METALIAKAFAVGEEPYLLWDEDVAERTRGFLSGLDSEYFSYVVRANQSTGDELRASVAIRLALHHATETMFSLIGALVQAPDCPYAWIARCSTSELRQVVKRINDGDATLISKFRLTSLGWEPIASLVFEGFEPGSERQQKVIQNFSKLWHRLAESQFTEAIGDEYNALKHGFRTTPGGFKIHVGPSDGSTEPPPESEMKFLGGSEHGATFYKLGRLEGNGGRHLSSQRIAMNWSLTGDALLLELIALSIHNILTRLKTANDFARDQCNYKTLDNDGDFVLPWQQAPGVARFAFPEGQLQGLPDVSKGALLSKLREAFNVTI